MRAAPLRFENPFGKHGCTALAFAHAGGLDADGARLLAWYAAERGLFNLRTKSGQSRRPQDFALWAELARVQMVRRIRPTVEGGEYGSLLERPCTLQRFLREDGARGMWLVYTAHHVQFVEDGTVYGYHLPRSRVNLAVEVRRIGA
jgi:hypothetical protein